MSLIYQPKLLHQAQADMSGSRGRFAAEVIKAGQRNSLHVAGCTGTQQEARAEHDLPVGKGIDLRPRRKKSLRDASLASDKRPGCCQLHQSFQPRVQVIQSRKIKCEIAFGLITGAPVEARRKACESDQLEHVALVAGGDDWL